MPFERPLCPAQALCQGWWSWVCCCCARVWVGAWVCICAPRFFHVSGWGPWGGPGAACSAAQEGYFFGSAALLRCAVLCLERPGPWAWCGVADGGGGGDLLSCMDGYGEGGALTDDEGPTQRGRARAKRGGGSAEVSRRCGVRARVPVSDPVGSLPALARWARYCGLGSKIFS